MNVVAYSAPLVSQPGDPSGQNRRRNMFDPVAMFDKGSRTSINLGKDFYNPHSYSGISANTFTAKPVQNPIIPPPPRISVNTMRYINPNTRTLTE